MSSQEPIAVVGSACRFPGDSDTPSKLWELLRSPRDLLRQVPPERYDADAHHHENGKHHGATNVRHAYFLNEDPAKFDSGFFNIQAGEAEAIDPQQRMLMETVYDSLCSAGQTIEALRGSQTSVFVGLMCDDWAGLMARDMETYPQYGATGAARSIMSNRISYYFDWHGPSMTIDTACSSSLVAVHQAIQTLHSGESQVAVATGANLILTPAMFVAESNLSMLSPQGRSRMWDKDVNGYARGEGLASVVLKTLSAAIRDGDHIECVIRGTGVNQDGRTPGLTMPSAKAQAALIKSTYERAGLDIGRPEDRPQFFHAHGTGTPAGDPQEAEAISTAFYGKGNHDDKLWVGSIKTIIGHTEGTAGLASLIGTSLALQHGVIPPNMHFKTLNPKLKPFYTHLQVPTKCVPWPETKPGQPKRASINSFGFGGTNAHAILEAYEPPSKHVPAPMGALFTPLTFSASSEASLRAMLSSYVDYMATMKQKTLHDLAYTLQHRRSTLAYRVAVAAPTVTDARAQLEAVLGGDKASSISERQISSKAAPRILGVFTGQGAQWARMGAKLLETSPFVFQRLAQLDQFLAESAAGDAPAWRLRDMILAEPAMSRMGEAAISQPLCTALQIVLVDLLRFAGVKLHAAVGHSSGEIGAAYAAGLLSDADAIRVAYYRGLYAKLAKSPNGGKGSMMAVGTTFEDATEFCELEWFEGRIQVAARNSDSSITLSGDEDAIDEAVIIFQDEGKFARKLKVDTAYHSSHVVPCSDPYRTAMEKCGIEGGVATGVKWHSSVYEKTLMTPKKMGPQYWVDNMVNAVLFSPAIGEAWNASGPFDLALEVGPAPVLKTPALDSIEAVAGQRPPYSGVLARGKDDVQEFSTALGYIWTKLGPGSVDFSSFQRAASGSAAVGRFLPNLPKYPFDHARQFMALSRSTGLHKAAKDPIHPLLGKRCTERETSQSVAWRNILDVKEIPWLTGHKIQGQMVFPATGYISMAVEAISHLAGNEEMSLFELRDLQIVKALAFNDEDSKVEVHFDLQAIKRSKDEISADFAIYSGAPYDINSALVLNAAGTIKVTLAEPEADQLPRVKLDEINLSRVDTDRFYTFLSKVGYNYSWPFHGTTSVQRKADYSIGTIEDQSGSAWEDQLIVHPGMLDTALQTSFAAFSCPGDERMWDLHLPKSFRSIRLNPYFTPLGIGKQPTFKYMSSFRTGKVVRAAADITLFSADGDHTFLQVDEMEIVPFSAAVQANDVVLFSQFAYKVAQPDAVLAAESYEATAQAEERPAIDDLQEGQGFDKGNEWISLLAEQLSHRYPKMHMVEVGTGSSVVAKRVISRLGDAFLTYTYADITGNAGKEAQEQLKEYANRTIFKSFDATQSPVEQGFVEGAYDVAICSNVLRTTPNVERSLTHLRRLVKPGGYAFIQDTVTADSLTLEQWDDLLRKTGFRGIDSVTPAISDANPGRVFSAQAIDERTEMLRYPLKHIAALPTTRAPQLYIIGGKTAKVSGMCDELSAMVAARFPKIERHENIEVFTKEKPPVANSTIICLTELEEPIMEVITPPKIDALRMIWQHCRDVMFVTSGCRLKTPHSYMILGMARCMRFEYPHLNLLTLDLDHLEEGTTTTIAENLLRLEPMGRWAQELQPEELLLTAETEIYMENNRAIIPRLYEDDDRNRRYNTTRRVVREDVPPAKAQLVFESGEGPWEAQVPSPLDLAAPLPFDTETRTLRVLYLHPSTISVAPGARLLPLVGRDEASGTLYVAAAPSTTSPAVVPGAWCFALPTDAAADAAGALAAFAASLAAARVLAGCATKGDTVVVHEPPAAVAAALLRAAGDVAVTLTTADANRAAAPGWLHINARLAEAAVKALLPRAATKFLDLSPSPAQTVLARCLPRGCDIVDPSSVFHLNTELRSSVAHDDVANALARAWTASQESGSSGREAPVIPIEDLARYSAEGGRFAVVDCTAPAVPAVVRAIDEGTLFRGDRTYFMVGLSGEMGQSICKWMVERGARHVALTSRSPKVSPVFIADMAALGASVKTFAMDVTDRASVQATYARLQETMPPLAGVANGAMVLRDDLFENMSCADFATCTNPKVIGSLLLDEVLGDTPLDFFVFFSSTAAVFGNSGQCNYVAANLFMNALAEKRRARGLVGSGADISSVIGLGFVERSDGLTESTFTEMGYRPVSEQDVQVIFAESILAGRVEQKGQSEVISGVQPLFSDFAGRDQYMRDNKFCHFWKERTDTQEAEGRSSNAPVRAQLAAAKSETEVMDIVRDEFLARMRKILSLGADEVVNERVTFVEQGLDSLMAVEVRAWLLKELEVDVPVLKILGGSSIADLLEHTIKSLPESIVDLSTLGKGGAGQAKKAPAAVPKAAPKSAPATPTPARTPAGASTPFDSTTGSSEASATPSESGDESPMSTPPESMSVSVHLGTPAEKHVEWADEGTDLMTSPMSYGQTGFWFLNEYLADKTVFNIAMMFKFTGPIRMAGLQDAVRMVSGRHETFRTRYFWAGEGDAKTPMQGISATSPLELKTRRIASEAEAVQELHRVRAHEWDLTTNDLFTMSVLSVSNRVHYMVCGMHHIAFDGYSFSTLFKEIEVAYTTKMLPALPAESQYRAFADKQRRDYEAGKMAQSVEYYRSVLPPAEELRPIELLPFAKTTTRQPLTRYGQHEATVTIPVELANQVRQLARLSKATSFHVYLVALQVLLFRLLPNEEEVFIGIADANRSDKEFMDSMGFFLNLLPLRLGRPEAAAPMTGVIETARDAAYAALGHSQLPFDVLLRELNVPRSSEYTPLFQVFLDYKQIYQERAAWCGTKIENETWRLASTGYDVALEVAEDTSGSVMLRLDLQDTLYTQESTELMLRSYVGVIEYMASAANGGALSSVPKWSPQDVEAALETGKGTPLEAQWQPTIIHRTDDLAQAQPDAVALTDDDGNRATYKEMQGRVDAIAQALEAAGVQKGAFVGVFQEPSVAWICSMLAVLRSGAVYVPLDLRNSIPRLASIVQRAKPTALLIDGTTASLVPQIGGEGATQIDVASIRTTGAAATTNRAERNAPAVVLFTSGSTGEPKGLVMSHTNLVSNAEANSHIYAATAADRESLVVLQQSAYSFDFSIDQTLAALTNGGRMHVVAARNRGDPAAIGQIMRDQSVTYTSSTPSEYDMWLRYGGEPLRSCATWRFAFSGGEAMNPGLAREFASLPLTGLRLFTGYGPAETTCFSTKIELAYRADAALPDPLPAGHMLRGYTVCVVDEDLKPVPHGVPGEIVIGGPCVVAGYLANAEATQQKFLPDAFFQAPTAVYRSGDRGRLAADGTLFCDGRLEGDLQVKIRGFRVELVEVEEALLRAANGALAQAVVSLRGGDDRAARHLVAHVVFRAGVPAAETDAVLRRLRLHLPLPPYMRPAAIAAVPDLPRTAHLKVDRRAVAALPVPAVAAASAEDGEAALTDAERRLAALWREVMPADPGALTAESDFFLIGGNSILLVKLQARIRTAFGASPKLVALMGAHELGAMADAVEESCRAATAAVIDWDAETSVPTALLAAEPPAPRAPKTDGLTVVLTGGQGYLGRHLLAALVADPQVARVESLVRAPSTTPLDAKVRETVADVAQAQLGLPAAAFAALGAAADAVVHCAANRSFWDRYEALRGPNVASVKELARLAAVHGAPLHVLSSGAVDAYAGARRPPTDGSDGYVAAKWAAEAFLRRLAADAPAVAPPAVAHRPTGAGAPAADAAAAAPLLAELMDLVRALGVRPAFAGVRGDVGFVPVAQTVEALKTAVLASAAAPNASAPAVRVQEHRAAFRVGVDAFASRVAADAAVAALPETPVLDWFGMAKRAGFAHLMTSWELTMGSQEGQLTLRR